MSYDNKYKQTHRMKLKQFVEDYKSIKGSCEHCGYNKHLEILEFHHKDPFTKKFGIGSITRIARGYDAIKEEMNKCLLLCPNCHRWLHFCEKESWGETSKNIKEHRELNNIKLPKCR